MAARSMTETSDLINPKIALKKSVDIKVSLLSKENPQLLSQLKHALTFPLDNQRATA